MRTRHIITEPEQIKALGTLLRRRILEAFGTQPMTTKQAAELLGEPPTRLYHHVAALEKAGLIEVVEERRKRGTIERYYQPIAREFVVDRRLFAGGAQEESTRNLQAVFTVALEQTLEEVSRGIESGLPDAGTPGNTAILARIRVRGSRERIEEVLERLRALTEELQSIECAEGLEDDVEYGLTFVFYPVIKSPPDAGEETPEEAPH